jgi:acyl-coenzyme A thioesterase PaaI-like protein
LELVLDGEMVVKVTPTPTDGPLKLVARVTEATDTRAVVEGELIGGDKVCATCHGVFVAVKPGHPAYHRW